MPKVTERPRFRVHTRAGKSGQIWTNYYWDGRSRQAKDIALGSDLAQALVFWQMCEDGIPLPTIDKPAKVKPLKAYTKLLPLRQEGKRRKFADATWDGLPEWAKRFYLNGERRAQDGRKPFRLTPADIAAVILRAAGHCEVSGIPLRERQEGDINRHPYSPSIDRIDCLKGYVPGNIRAVCLIVNVAMNEWGEDQLFEVAERVCGNRVRQVSATEKSG